jgi:hypothetical protein
MASRDDIIGDAAIAILVLEQGSFGKREDLVDIPEYCERGAVSKNTQNRLSFM